VFLRIKGPRWMVPKHLAKIVVWLGNFIGIGMIGWMDVKKDLQGQVWFVAPLSRIQWQEKKFSPEWLVDEV